MVQKEYMIYLEETDQQIGPFPVQQLKRNGLKIDSQVFAEGMTQWQKAFTVPELQGLFPAEEIKKRLPRMFAAPFSFKGRIRRKEYALTWGICAASGIVMFLCYLLSMVLGSIFGLVLSIIIFAATWWFFLAQGAKRCHDYNDEGKAQAIPVIIGGNPHGVLYALLSITLIDWLFSLIVIAGFAVLAGFLYKNMFTEDGWVGDNDYGLAPKGMLNLTESQREETNNKINKNYWLIVGGVAVALALLSSLPLLFI